MDGDLHGHLKQDTIHSWFGAKQILWGVVSLLTTMDTSTINYGSAIMDQGKFTTSFS